MSTVDKIKNAVKKFATATEGLISEFIDSRTLEIVKAELDKYRTEQFPKVFGTVLTDNPEYNKFRKFQSAIHMSFKRAKEAKKTDAQKRTACLKDIGQKSIKANTLKVDVSDVLEAIVSAYGIDAVVKAVETLKVEADKVHATTGSDTEPEQVQTVNK